MTENEALALCGFAVPVLCALAIIWLVRRPTFVCADPGPALALSPYDTSSTVTASTTHQSVALASPALAVEAFNSGAVVAYIELGGTAASSTGIPLQGTPGAGVIRCTVFSEVFVAPTS